MTVKRMIPLLLAALFAAGPARAVELDLDFVAAGTAPLSEVLRKASPLKVSGHTAHDLDLRRLCAASSRAVET